MRDVKVGYLIPYREVPDGTLVRPSDGGFLLVFADERHLWTATVGGNDVTVIALGLSRDVSLEHLEAMAEAFEAKEAARA